MGLRGQETLRPHCCPIKTQTAGPWQTEQQVFRDINWSISKSGADVIFCNHRDRSDCSSSCSPGSRAPLGQSPQVSAVCTWRGYQPSPQCWSASGRIHMSPGWDHSSPSVQGWGVAGEVCLAVSVSRPSGHHSDPLWTLHHAVTAREKTVKAAAIITDGLEPIRPSSTV